MALELKPGSAWWYTRWMRDGKRHFAKLEVRVKGTRPCAEFPAGDAAFVASREAAEDADKALVAKWSEERRPEDLVQEIHRVKFGHRIGAIPLSRLFATWEAIPRKRRPKEPYVKWAERTFERLLEFVGTDFPRVKEMAGVDKKVAEGFMRHEEKRGVSPKTFNAELILLRGAFEHLREDAGMLGNPFAKIVTKDRETIHRKPFTPEELKAIMEAVKDDDLMRPLVVVGVCTAMRRGDACLLKWESVDLKNGYILVKTSKTGETVEIPVFPLLRDELAARPSAAGGYVFPELAQMYLKNPDGVNWRLGKVFERAGFLDDEVVKALKKKHPGTEILQRGEVHVSRERGLHTANVRGFHSFRVTWITMALAAGVPMELVRRVTGHKAAEVVLKNYFKPGRADFAKAIEGAMPRMLLEGVKSKGVGELLDDVLEALEAMKAKTWAKQRAKAAALVRKAKNVVDGRVRVATAEEPRALEASAAARGQ